MSQDLAGTGTHEEQEVYTIHQTKNQTKRIKSFGSAGYEIISSTDHPFAIADTLRNCLQHTKKSLLISAPYFSKSFIDLVRTSPKGLVIKFLTRIPDKENYWVLRAIESLTTIASSLGLELNIQCKPNLHAKFIVIDNEMVLQGSLNPTSAGMLENDELLNVFKNPAVVKRHQEIFDKLWNSPRNTIWEKAQNYFGHKGYVNPHQTQRAIAEAIIGFFQLNHNQAVKKAVLCERIAKRGFDKDIVIETVKALLDDGVLFPPKRDLVKLTNMQTNIHDF